MVAKKAAFPYFFQEFTFLVCVFIAFGVITMKEMIIGGVLYSCLHQEKSVSGFTFNRMNHKILAAFLQQGFFSCFVCF